MLGGRVLDEAIENSGPVEPGRDGKPPGDYQNTHLAA
jgi:hypothetical protein